MKFLLRTLSKETIDTKRETHVSPSINQSLHKVAFFSVWTLKETFLHPCLSHFSHSITSSKEKVKNYATRTISPTKKNISFVKTEEKKLSFFSMVPLLRLLSPP